MATTRFPDSSKALTQSTLNDNTLIPCRYKAGTVDDTDKAITFSMMQTTPIAVCTSASGTVNKIASIDNFPDFTLVNGREVVVYFSNGNSAESPSININGTGSILMDGAYWNAGTFMRLKYVDITVSGNRIQKWLVDMGAFNNTTQLNGALTELHQPFELLGNTNVGGAWYEVNQKNYNVIQFRVALYTGRNINVYGALFNVGDFPDNNTTITNYVTLQRNIDGHNGFDFNVCRKNGILQMSLGIHVDGYSIYCYGVR